MQRKEQIIEALKDTVLGRLYPDQIYDSLTEGVIEIHTHCDSISYTEMGPIIQALGGTDLWLEVWECGTSEDLVTGLTVCVQVLL